MPNNQTRRLSRRVRGSIGEAAKPVDKCPPHDYKFEYEYGGKRYYSCTKCNKIMTK